VKTALQGVGGETGLLEYLTRQEQVVLDAGETIRKIREATRQKNVEVFEPVALTEVVKEVLAITQPRWKDQAEAAGVRITIHTAVTETLPVMGRAAELREALTNLLFNALDAMPQGGTVTIATRQNPPTPPLQKGGMGGFGGQEAEGAAQGWVELTVTDTGIGMSPAVQARLFEPFFTTKGVRGTGLGLSMVYGIVSRHDGEITVQSAEGQGTTITLRLPVTTVTTAEAVQPSTALPPIADSLRLLIIDDDPLLAETLGELLRLQGHETAIATSGRDGLIRLAAEPFDLVITDLGMPEMSGWEVAQAIKASRPGLPVIMVTGWGDALEHERLDGTGVAAILAKPYTDAQLRRVLAQTLARSRRAETR
jgi:CheY-like chemotaxis protein